MAILGKNSHFLPEILIKKEFFFGRLCLQAFLVIPICGNFFLKAQFILKGNGSIQFYSLAKELCSLDFDFLKRPLVSAVIRSQNLDAV